LAEVKWIKLVTDVFDNRKIRQIECLPDGDGIIVIWFKLLCLAGSINDSGAIYFTKDIPYTEQMLAQQFNRPLPLIQMALSTFKSFGMVDITENFLCVSNWEKYQNTERLSELREYNRLAKQKSRAKQKALAAVNDMSMTSQCGHYTDIDKDIEEDIDIDIKKKPTRHKYGEYKNVLLSDEDLEKLKSKYPSIYESYIERLSAYIASKGAKYKNHYATILNWIRKDEEKNNGKEDGYAGSRKRSAERADEKWGRFGQYF